MNDNILASFTVGNVEFVFPDGEDLLIIKKNGLSISLSMEVMAELIKILNRETTKFEGEIVDKLNGLTGGEI